MTPFLITGYYPGTMEYDFACYLEAHSGFRGAIVLVSVLVVMWVAWPTRRPW